MVELNKDIYSLPLSSGAGGFIDRIVTRKRAEMFDRIIRSGHLAPERISTVLDVGSTKDNDSKSSNYFARRFSEIASVSLISDQKIDADRDLDFPVRACLVGDATKIETGGERFDLVFSSATIEHVGDETGQAAMIRSCVDVADYRVVLTTPNRWHPVEFHTSLPFLHWLPKSLHRRIIRLLGFGFFAEESNLNLLDRSALEALMTGLQSDERIKASRIETVRFLGFVSNLILIIDIEN